MRTHRRVGITIFLLVVTAAAVAVLAPGSSTDSQTLSSADRGASTPAASGLKVYLDAETGEVTGDINASAAIELDAELQNALSHDPTGLITVRHADGSESLDLQGRYQEASVVRIDANGKAVVCVDDVAKVEKTLTDTTPILPEVK